MTMIKKKFKNLKKETLHPHYKEKKERNATLIPHVEKAGWL